MLITPKDIPNRLGASEPSHEFPNTAASPENTDYTPTVGLDRFYKATPSTRRLHELPCRSGVSVYCSPVK